MLMKFFLIFILKLPIFSLARQCLPTEFLYEYTKCDQHGERWRIAVPKSHSLHCDNVPPPKAGVNCSFSCGAGQYLNLEEQKCRVCDPGTYSLGNGVRYEDFATLPSGFSIENYEDDVDHLLSQMNDNSNPFAGCSKESGWVLQNSELRYIPTTCISKLSISVHLVQNGYVQIFYKMPKNSRGLISNLDVRNEQCESYANHLSSLVPIGEDINTGTDWKMKTLNLKTGQNLITWTVANNRELTTLADVIYIAKIDIVGLAFSSECTRCPEGTHSGSEKKQCEPCGEGYYSNSKGSSECKKCDDNEYSGPRASKCVLRPQCTAADFYPEYQKCSQNHSNVIYKKVKPSVCREDMELAKNMPASKFGLPCPLCNPGMQRNADGQCEFCKNREFSIGNECKPCKAKTHPNNGFYYTRWDTLPDNMKTSCEYAVAEEGEECQQVTSWIPSGDKIQTAPTRAKGLALELSLNITTGFYNPLMSKDSIPSIENPIAFVAFEFEMQCKDENCILYFVEALNTPKKKLFRFLAAFNGTQKRQIYVEPIITSSSTRFVFAFMRSGAPNGQDVLTDKAIIYSINVTNVGSEAEKKSYGGADSCRPCPSFNGNTGLCEACPPGNYIDLTTTQCVLCPPGTALNMSSSRIGLESCVPCGPNLDSADRTACGFTGELTLPSNEGINKTLKFDLSSLKNQSIVAEGIKVFAREGSSYYHSYNISLFGKSLECKENNMPSVMALEGTPYVNPVDSQSVFCRSTAVPLKIDGQNKSAHEKIVFISSFSIAKKLAAVTQNRTYKNFVLSDKILEYDSTSESNRPIDIHFFFEPVPSKFRSCPNGTIGVLTARCEPTAMKTVQVRLPRTCPDGTCNGCLYHVIMETSSACPICEKNDFEEIRGECKNGYKKIHWIPSKHCIISGAERREVSEFCTNLTDGTKLLLIIATLIIALLIVAVFAFYQKNKSLEYRYMRLVEGKEPEEMETCGLESSDEDDEEDSGTRVIFGKKKSNYVAKMSTHAKNGKALKNSSGYAADAERAEFLSDSTD